MSLSNIAVYLFCFQLLKGVDYSEHVLVHTIYCGEMCTPNEQSRFIVDFFNSIDNPRSIKRRRTHISDSESDSE